MSFLEALAMRKITCLLPGVLAFSGAFVGSVYGDTYFFDDFENQPINAPGTPIQPPPIGLKYINQPLGSESAVSIVTSPAKGTKSLESVRQGGTGTNLYGVSTTGAVADGKSLE